MVLPNIGKVQLLRTSRSKFDSALCGLGKMAPKAMLCTDLAGMLLLFLSMSGTVTWGGDVVKIKALPIQSFTKLSSQILCHFKIYPKTLKH